MGAPVLELLAPKRGERILDLGCGDGALTVKLAGYGCEVVAVDASPEMIEAAKALDLDARVMDGQALSFEGEFDAVFTNAALHWMKNPVAVVAGVERALKPGGELACGLCALAFLCQERVGLGDCAACSRIILLLLVVCTEAAGRRS